MECVLPFAGTLPPLVQTCCTLSKQRSHVPSLGFASRTREFDLVEKIPWRDSMTVCRGSRTNSGVIICFASRDGPPPSPKISTDAKIRSEVISPFRSVRIFFYLAFIASGSIGTLISLPRLIAALGNAPNAPPIVDVLSGLGIDLVAVLVFALLYRSDVKARDLQLAKLSREETLGGLKIELNNKRVITVGKMRGIARLVIVAGPVVHIEEACRRSQQYYSQLLERGVVVIYFATDGQAPNLEYSVNDDENAIEIGEGKDSDTANPVQVEKLWRGKTIYTSEWAKWLGDQKKLANVKDESPVYLSLRLDGRVRGSGTGFPPWGAFAAQLPPMKGMWGGVFDGMDGRI